MDAAEHHVAHQRLRGHAPATSLDTPSAAAGAARRRHGARARHGAARARAGRAAGARRGALVRRRVARGRGSAARAARRRRDRRAAAVWGFEAVGRRAATGILSQLRLDLVESRLRDHPAALDGAESAEVATTAVQGVDALETTFARYLPQVVLAAVVPVAVLVLVASIDPLSAAVMLLTLPLVPVFMWLIGRTTAKRTRDRWQALTLLSTHFLDVVRGLPTLRAFNRGEAQASGSRRSATSTGARRWARCASRSSPAPCSSWRRRSGSRSSR